MGLEAVERLRVLDEAGMGVVVSVQADAGVAVDGDEAVSAAEVVDVRAPPAQQPVMQQRQQQQRLQAEVKEKQPVTVVELTEDGQRQRAVTAAQQHVQKEEEQQQQASVAVMASAPDTHPGEGEPAGGQTGVLAVQPLVAAGVVVWPAVVGSAGRRGAVVGSVAWPVGRLLIHSLRHVTHLPLLLSMGRSVSVAAEQLIGRRKVEWTGRVWRLVVVLEWQQQVHPMTEPMVPRRQWQQTAFEQSDCHWPSVAVKWVRRLVRSGR